MRYQTEPGNEEKTKKFAVGCVSLPQNEIEVRSTHSTEVLCSYKSRIVWMIFCPYKGSEFQRAARKVDGGGEAALDKAKTHVFLN
jgi:hypothetical protein